MMAEIQHSKRNGGKSTARSDSKDSQAQGSSVAAVARPKGCYVAENFEDMDLREAVLQSVKAHVFTTPTPLQKRAITPLTSGYNVVLQSCPSSGKKTTISMAVLQITDVDLKACQVLVLTPTNSAAEIMKSTINDMGECTNIRCDTCTGERPLKEDIRILAKGVHVVIGTLERTYDLMKRNSLRRSEIKLFVIEEADKMLMCASKNVIWYMIEMLNRNVQLLFLTTTIEHILSELKNILHYPVFLVNEKEVQILENTEHFYIRVLKKRSRLEILFALYKRFIIKRALIFCQTGQEAKMVAKNMKLKNVKMTFLRDTVRHREKDRILREFQADNVHILLITDIHSFGDELQASVIINYDFPTTFEKYYVRTCRKSRTNHKITVISFVTKNEERTRLPFLERFCHIKTNQMEILNTESCNFSSKPCGLLKKDDPAKKSVCISFIKQSFEELNLRKELIKAINDYGFQRPTPLQRNAIFPCINGYDVIIHGHPRASKTTTLAIATLQNINDTSQCCEALVLTSSRDKAQYMYEFLRELGKSMKVKCSVFYGGRPVHVDLPVLEKNAHIIVGTAGRIMDLIDRKALRTNTIKMLVLEEASSLFSDMQREQTHKIFQALNSDIQIIVSSTIPRNDAMTQLKQFTKGSFCVLTYTHEISPSNMRSIRQFYLPLKRSNLIYETVSDLYNKLTVPQSVIFCNKNQKSDDSKIHPTDLSESDFLELIRSEEKEAIKENFFSVCNYTLFSTSLLTKRKNNKVSVIMNYDFLTQKKNYMYSSDESHYHKAIVANISNEKEITIHELENFLA